MLKYVLMFLLIVIYVFGGIILEERNLIKDPSAFATFGGVIGALMMFVMLEVN